MDPLHNFSHKVPDVIARMRFTIHVSFFFLLLLLLLLLLLFFIYIFLAVVVDFSTVNSIWVHYLRDPQTSLFSNFFIKNGSHSTIHIFKNYFVTMFLVFSKISCIQTDPKKINLVVMMPKIVSKSYSPYML